jgi:hypothetical protein
MLLFTVQFFGKTEGRTICANASFSVIQTLQQTLCIRIERMGKKCLVHSALRASREKLSIFISVAAADSATKLS